MTRKASQVMTPQHKDWARFCELLEGPEGCDFKEDPKNKGGFTSKCNGKIDRPLATKILKRYFPRVNVYASLDFFERHGGFCDCEILLNVEQTTDFVGRES
jgi:hypothetical protein